MSKKSKKNRVGIVFSTNPDFEYEYQNEEYDDTPAPDKQRLHSRIEKKGRGGKTVTLISGFRGNPDDLNTLAKRLKSSCGVGGSTEDGDILLQGDVRNKAAEFLKKWGYNIR